ncbi:GL13596 [Drosophila persimilis]|uniref:GL13596 n=1 Tax=Drosophila persimilis TaxID=7234 RepID=B4GPJ2_DROPE|nr:GL13596 [Drosophila persimilis]
MSYMPEITYDENLKVWSGPERSNYFPSYLSIGEIIFREMESHPELVAQISATEKTVLTRQEIRFNAMRVASYMRGLGLKKTDIVGLVARNTTHLVAVAYDCFFNGIPFHSLNIAYEQSTIEKLFNITRPRLIFCDGDEYERVLAATENLGTRIITMRYHLFGKSSRIQDILTTPIGKNFQPSSSPPARPDFGHSLLLRNDGHTESSHELLSMSFRMTSNMQHTYMQHSGLKLRSGVYHSSIIAGNEFDPGFMCSMIQEYKIGVLLECSSHLFMLANYPGFEDADLSSIEHIIFGGSHCSLEVQQRVRYRIKGRGSVTSRDAQKWFHPGDLGYVDLDGFLFIKDRRKDMLKCHSVMYYPNEIENVISKMPNVAEIYI